MVHWKNALSQERPNSYPVEVIKRSIPVDQDSPSTFGILTSKGLLQHFSMKNTGNRFVQRVGDVKFVRGFTFEDLTAERAFKDDFGDSHQTPSAKYYASPR